MSSADVDDARHKREEAERRARRKVRLKGSKGESRVDCCQSLLYLLSVVVPISRSSLSSAGLKIFSHWVRKRSKAS